jgi:ABC-type uncharacterized transport system YnjBCD permease subunit
MQEFFGQYFGALVLLIVVAIALTIFVFRKRLFERGYRKGVAANPREVKEQNRPDHWSQSH